MNIHITGPIGSDPASAARDLGTLVHEWGVETTQTAPQEIEVTHHDGSGTGQDAEKVIDPISLTALVLSLPSTALAVRDLTDRISRRRRAQQLIDHARRLAERNITVIVTEHTRTIDLHTLTPDELLDLAAHDTDIGSEK